MLATATAIAAAAVLLQVGKDPAPVKGPYTLKKTSFKNPAMDSSDTKIDVYYPAEKGSFPLIAYAHGYDNEPTDYSKQMEALVSFGFIITSHWACHTGCKDDKASLKGDPGAYAHYYKQQLLAIDWAKKEASSGNNTVLSKLNFSQGVAIAGHSMGGQSTVFSSSFSNASNHGIVVAAFHHAFTHEYPAPQIPFLAFTGKEDDVASHTMSEDVFNAAGGCTTKGLVDKKDANHFEPEDPFFPEEHCYNDLLPQFTAAWFKLHLEKKTTEFGIDFQEMIFGNGTKSICGGGDGDMAKCEVHR